MYQGRVQAPSATADPRPKSAVSTGCGVAGLIGLIAWVGYARWHAPVLDGPYAALVNLVACALPMVAWAVLVDKVHCNPTTGIDWTCIRPWVQSRDVTVAKLVGLWTTWAGVAATYAIGRFYWQGDFVFAMGCFQVAAPALVALSIPYLFYLDRRATEPQDGCYAFGCWIMGTPDGTDHAAIFDHLRAWAVKAFFLAFMLSIVPAGFGNFVRADTGQLLRDPVALSSWLITFMFVVDVTFATVGYMLTLRPLDAHIRSANPFVAGWTAALICYPPFVLMGEGGPFDYHPGTSDWTHWFAGHPVILGMIGATLVILTAIYAWATVAFGFRFSNLTHRGIVTHGPYALSRHPAYLTKNLFWFVSTIPVLTTGNWHDAVRATVLMGVVAGIYYWRARTEERHLSMDLAYQEYSAWMTRNAPVPRFFGWLSARI